MAGFTFFRFAPSPPLSPFIECLWGVRGSAHHHVESVLPNGAIELMVNFGPRPRVIAYGDRESDDEFGRAWIAGIQDQRLVHAAPEGSDHLAARFRAGGAHAFFDLPMDELTNRVVDLGDVVGDGAANGLWTRLREIDTDEARCRGLERWLLRRRHTEHPHYTSVRRALDLLRAGAHGTPVGEVCERLGLSNRHLIKQFRMTVGLTPKSYARIARFRRVIEACHGIEDVPWAAVAARFGYVDQSHLIREFRALAMVTPEEFLARRTPDQSHVVGE